LPGFCGVKTGITSTAGSCLAVYFKNQELDRNLITVVLGSRNIEYRWKDTRRLTLYANEVLMQEKQRKTSPKKKLSSAPLRFERSKL
jgi:D-alanyl-D-alanine carboxypeptidase